MNILVDPVGFLLINRVPIPEHWSSNISLSSPPVTALLPPPFLTPGVNLSSSGNLANPNIIDFDHQFFRNEELFLFLYIHSHFFIAKLILESLYLSNQMV